MDIVAQLGRTARDVPREAADAAVEMPIRYRAAPAIDQGRPAQWGDAKIPPTDLPWRHQKRKVLRWQARAVQPFQRRPRLFPDFGQPPDEPISAPTAIGEAGTDQRPLETEVADAMCPEELLCPIEKLTLRALHL